VTARPLPSWRDTAARRSILTFVAGVTDPDHEAFVPPAERVAVFDNDGTLWCEQPLVQGAFILQRFAALARSDPSLRLRQPWKAAFENDTSWIQEAGAKHYNGDDADMKLLLDATLKAFRDVDVEAFTSDVEAFFAAGRHPVYGCPYPDVAYLPMVELLGFLEDMGFTTYICSGGGRDFMRPVTQATYGVPPERVIGSAPEMIFRADDGGAHVIRQSSIDIFDEGPGKPIQIWDRVGRRPILAGGNANGDIPMFQFTALQERPSLCLLLRHDDDEREVGYDTGAERVQAAADEHGWTVLSMKNDWERVFAFEAESG